MDVEEDHNYVADGILTHNCINTFAGASEKAYRTLCEYRNTTLFELPVCYRCPISHVKNVLKFTPNMRWREGAPEGEIVENVHISELKKDDLVLCRSRAPLFLLYNKLLKRNVKSYITGNNEDYEKIISIINSCNSELLNKDLKARGLFSEMYTKLFAQRDYIMNTTGLDLDDATVAHPVLEAYDTITSLMELSDGIDTKNELIERIKKVFDNNGEGIRLSTIHKAKGAEAKNVYILCYSSMPSKLATKEWEKKEEQNLIYVALTRATNRIGFVSEKEVPINGILFQRGIALDNLYEIEKRVCEINGTKMTKTMDCQQMGKPKPKTTSNAFKLPPNLNVIEL